MSDLSSFHLADMFQKIVKIELGIDVIFKAIDLELKIKE